MTVYKEYKYTGWQTNVPLTVAALSLSSMNAGAACVWVVADVDTTRFMRLGASDFTSVAVFMVAIVSFWEHTRGIETTFIQNS